MKYKMNKRWKTMLIICFSVFFSVNNLSAQSVWEEVIEQWVNNQESNSYQLENLIESLDELKENPLPINIATKEQLERFPFLSDQLIENILYYIYKHGPMLSDKELMLVKDMDQQTARCLKLFITFQRLYKFHSFHTIYKRKTLVIFWYALPQFPGFPLGYPSWKLMSPLVHLHYKVCIYLFKSFCKMNVYHSPVLLSKSNKIFSADVSPCNSHKRALPE